MLRPALPNVPWVVLLLAKAQVLNNVPGTHGWSVQIAGPGSGRER